MRYCSSIFHFFNLLINLLNIGIVKGIIGGFDARVDQFKYVVMIQANKEVKCSGVIIGERHVLSTAHCFIDQNNKFKNYEFSILGGIIDKRNKNHRKIELNVEKIYVPVEYRFINYYNPRLIEEDMIGDIAVLKLEDGFNLETNFARSKIKLPSKADVSLNYENEEPIVSGFGYNVANRYKDLSGEEKVDLSNSFIKLKYAETRIIDNFECQMKYVNPIHYTHICAQVKQRNPQYPEGVCKGDSGGPLVIHGDILIGIYASGSSTCNELKQPGIYTKIAYLLPFIENAMLDKKSPQIRTAVYETKHSPFHKFNILTEQGK